jgi:hypothetical protein
MSIDLRVEKVGSGTWTRHFGEHEEQGFKIYANAVSAHVTVTAFGIQFDVDRRDVPAAWDEKIDVVTLREQLIATISRRMSTEVVEELFREFHLQRQHAFQDGESAAKHAIQKAIGL